MSTVSYQVNDLWISHFYTPSIIFKGHFYNSGDMSKSVSCYNCDDVTHVKYDVVTCGLTSELQSSFQVKSHFPRESSSLWTSLQSLSFHQLYLNYFSNSFQFVSCLLN